MATAKEFPPEKIRSIVAEVASLLKERKESVCVAETVCFLLHSVSKTEGVWGNLLTFWGTVGSRRPNICFSSQHTGCKQHLQGWLDCMSILFLPTLSLSLLPLDFIADKQIALHA